MFAMSSHSLVFKSLWAKCESVWERERDNGSRRTTKEEERQQINEKYMKKKKTEHFNCH